MTSAPTLATVDQPYNPILRELGRFDQKRGFTSQIQRLMQTDPWTRDIGQRMSHCATRLGLRLELDDGECTAIRLQNASLCGARLCPFCEWRRTKAWRRRLIQGLDRFHQAHPTHKAIFATFTVKNCPITEVREQIKQLHDAFNRMRQCSFFPTEFWFRRTELTIRPLDMAGRLIEAATATREGTNSKVLPAPTGAVARWEAHPHLHVLLLVPASYFSTGYVRNTEWQQQWQMAARLDYAPIVDIRRATAKRGSREPDNPDVGAAIEAAKYISKATDLLKLGPQLPQLHEQLKGLRMIGVSRPLQQFVRSDDPDSAEQMDIEDGDILSDLGLYVKAEWNEVGGCYEITP